MKQNHAKGSPSNHQRSTNALDREKAVLSKRMQKHWAKIIFSARRFLGWSQEKFAEETGVGTNTVYRIEGGTGGNPETITLVREKIDEIYKKKNGENFPWHKLGSGNSPLLATSPVKLNHQLLKNSNSTADARKIHRLLLKATTLTFLNFIFEKYHSDQTRRDFETLRTFRLKWGDTNDQWAAQWGKFRNSNDPIEREGANEVDAARRRIFAIFYRMRLLVLNEYIEIERVFSIFGGFSARATRDYLLPMNKVITPDYDKGFYEFWEGVEQNDWRIPAMQVVDARKRIKKYRDEIKKEFPEVYT